MEGIFSQYDSQDLNRLAAKGILEKLRNIRQRINVDFTARRLLWELIQNAKDNAAICCINKNPKVKIEIEIQQNQLIFKHNNGYFTNENIRGLIRRYSSSDKDRQIYETSPPLPTGRFGTGFMTTHLLSERVSVDGFFKENETSFRKFELPLDRTGLSEKEIDESIQNAFSSTEKSILASKSYNLSEAANFKTRFLYTLNHEGYELARKALSGFDSCIAYTLINIPNIESVSIKHIDEVHNYDIRKIEEYKSDEFSIKIVELNSNNSDIIHRHYCTISNKHTKVILPIKYSEDKIEIQALDQHIPRLFLDFPMIGTEGLNIPFVINNPLFEPTEPRDGVSLTGGEDKDTKLNSTIILEAFNLYKYFVRFSCDQKNWNNLYNLARIKVPSEKPWMNLGWFKSKVLNPTYEKLLTTPIVETNGGERSCIKDPDGENLIYFPYSGKEEVRDKIWEFSNDLFSNELPIKEHIHEWHDIIWKDCYKQTLKTLSGDIEEKKNIDSLSHAINKNKKETIEWLNNFYDLLNLEGKTINEVIKDEIVIIPNQNGVFTKKSKLNWDKEIEPELKNVLKILGEDIREVLIYNGIVTKSQYTNKKTGQLRYHSKNQSEIINKINIKLKRSNEKKEEAIYHLISLFSESEEFPIKRHEIYKFSRSLIGNSIPDIKKISTWEDSIWEHADKFIINTLIKKVSECNSINSLVKVIASDSVSDTKKWIQSFIDFLENNNLHGKLNLNANPILPNQNGIFRIKDDIHLDNGDIDKDLKDIARDFSYDVRNDLLDEEIFLRLPNNRIIDQEQVAQKISNLIKPIIRDVDSRSEYSDAIRKLYLWMNKNRIYAEQIFGDIYEKRFLLISDDEIIENINKAELFDEIIDETGFSAKEIKEGLNKLDSIKANIDISVLDELISISGKIGGIDEILENAKDLLQEKQHFEYLKNIGENVEIVFKKALIQEGITAEIIHKGWGSHDFEIKNISNEKSMFIELKSIASGSTLPLKLAVSQAKKAIEKPDKFALCILERPLDSDAITPTFIRKNLKYRKNIANELQNAMQENSDFERIRNNQSEVHLHIKLREDVRISVDHNLVIEDSSGFNELIVDIRNQIN